MTIDNILLDMDTNVKNANVVKALVVERLLKDEIINKEQAEKYNIDFQIVILKRSWFKQLWTDLTSKEKDGFVYRYLNLTD